MARAAAIFRSDDNDLPFELANPVTTSTPSLPVVEATNLRKTLKSAASSLDEFAPKEIGCDATVPAKTGKPFARIFKTASPSGMVLIGGA